MSYRVVKQRRSSKSLKFLKVRRSETVDYIVFFRKNLVMIACIECVNHDSACYYDRNHSIACSECIKNRRECDGTFSVEELRKWSEEKIRLRKEFLKKRQEIARLINKNNFF